MTTIRSRIRSVTIMRIMLGLVAFAVLCLYSSKAWAATGNGAEQYPRLGSDGENGFYAIWESDFALYGALSIDNGATWAAPQKLDETPVLWNGRYDMNPQTVVYANGEWVVYYRYSKFNFTDGAWTVDYVIRSADGITWTPKHLLYRCVTHMSFVRPPARLSMADMASDKNNTIIAFTGPGEHVFRSINGGETWTSSTLSVGKYTNFGLDRYKVAYAGNQTWYITYSGNTGFTAPPEGAFSAVHRSTDNGQTWTTVDTTTDIKIAGALAAQGNQLAVFNDPDFNFSLDGGTTWQTPATTQSATLNALVVDSEGNWVAASDDGFYATTSLADGWTSSPVPAIPGAGSAVWPAFASNGSRIGLLRSYSADWDAWPLHSNIIFQHSDDGGFTWNRPNMISEEPTAARDWQLFQ